MPAIVTHDFFGRDIYDKLYTLIGGSRDEADAFLLGNQGPDPLFYLAIRPRYVRFMHIGSTFHHKRPTEVVAAFKSALSVLDESELAVGRAYTLGFLCHYALDSTAHPLVNYHIESICGAGIPGLTYNGKSEVHATIEADFDELMLFTRRGITITTYNPSKEILKASDQVLDIISKLYVYVALTVYGIAVIPSLFKAAVKNYRFTERAIYSPRGIRRAVQGNIERIVRPHSFIQALSLRPVEMTESMFDNHEHLTWENPYTGAESTEGFWDLYEKALQKAQDAIYAFDRPSFGVEAARSLTNDINFEGEPVVALIMSVENDVASNDSQDSNSQPTSTSQPASTPQQTSTIK